MLLALYCENSDTSETAWLDGYVEPEDHKSAGAHRSKARARQSLLARALLRLLFRATASSPESATALSIARSENGGLHLTDAMSGATLFGSVSHSGPLVCAALSDLGPIGIDGEWINHGRDIVNLVQQIAPSFRGTPREAYRLWTRNEACGKALGCGLLLPVPPVLAEPQFLAAQNREPDTSSSCTLQLSIGGEAVTCRSFSLADFELTIAVRPLPQGREINQRP